jgi:cell pole-organizing protein PopZ
MNKPNPMGAKSLEEVLASIRKSLAEEPAEEPVDRPAEPRLAPVQAPQPEAKPASPANIAAKGPGSGSDSGSGSGLLSSKLAGALNGATRAAAVDDDLRDLLATEPKKPAASAPSGAAKLAGAAKPAAAAKPPESGSDVKDPLWFLTRLSAAAAGNASQGSGSAARARDVAKAPPTEEVKLSRPEILRASLPPLFGAAVERAPAPIAWARAEAAPTDEKPADSVSLTVRTEPRTAPPQSVSETVTARAEPEAPSVVTPAPETIAEAASPAAPAPQDTARAGALETWLQVQVEAPAFDDPAPPVAEAAFAALTEVKAEIVPEIVPERALLLVDSTPAANPLPAGTTLPTRALEQVIAELLEPAIQQWLQTQLPRMIETVVREEVARAVAAEREATKV